MGQFEIGQVVVVKFPFSNLAHAKNRPALVLAVGDYGNPVLCQITSMAGDKLDWVIQINKADMEGKGLEILSYIRVDKIFTADPSIIVSTVGIISATKRLEVKHKLGLLLGL